MRPSSLASSLPPFLPSATYRAKPLLATHSTILLLFPRTNSSSVARESDATVGSKARKIFALRNRPCRVNEQAANLHTSTHTRAHTLGRLVNSSQWRGLGFSNRFSFFAPKFRILSDLSASTTPSLSLSLSRTNICPLVLIRARKTNSPQPRISRFSTRNLARHLHSPSTRLDVARTRRGGSVVESRAIKTSGNIPPICGVSETQRSMRRSDTGKAFPLFNSSPLLLDFEKHSSILARCKRRLIYAGRASITFFPPSLPFPFPPFASLSRLPRSRRIRAVAGDDSTLLPFPGKRGR